MEGVATASIKKDLQKIRSLKYFLLVSLGVFFLRYVLLLVSIIWNDFFSFQDIPILFIVQIILAVLAFILFCYGFLGIKEYFPSKKEKQVMKSVVWTLVTIIALLILLFIYWTIASFLPSSESYPYELWLESIVIAMPFTELIPLSIAMLFLAFSFWLLRKEPGWNTNILVTPFFLLPITIVRVVAAILKVINILDTTKYSFAWDMAEYSRIIYAVIGLLLSAEILFYIWRMKPKIILSNK